MNIDALATSTGDDLFYDKGLMIVFEDHLTYLRKSSDTKIITIESQVAYKYEGDLFGLLYHYSYPKQLHWLIMRMNGITTPTDTTFKLSTLLIPNPQTVDRIKNVYNTRKMIVQ